MKDKMEKYLINFIRTDTKTAGAKAEADIATFLKSQGFLSIYFDTDLPRLVGLFFEDYLISKKIKQIKAEDVCVLQYSLYSRYHLKKFIQKISQVSTNILVIHDIISLREFSSNADLVRQEIEVFNLFSAIVAHNEEMKRWLITNGVTVPVYSLEIFDYDVPSFLQLEEGNKNSGIVFAGNLDKSEFLSTWQANVPVYLYGINTLNLQYSANLNYLGSQSPTQISQTIARYAFGLVWDGSSVESCTGMFGEYLKYNNPHKTSLYLSSGLPVIIWKEAALAKFIETRGLGIAVSTLAEAEKIIEELSEEEYQVMRKNCQKIAKQLSQGEFTQAAINQILGLQNG